MSVVVRKFSACPVRTASQTWEAIIEALCGADDVAKSELQAIAGLASSIIADGSPKKCPITIVGSGPRLRIYCLYEEDGDTEDANESKIAWKLLDGDWQIHFPVKKEDLGWISKALKEKGPRFKAYESGTKPDNETSETTRQNASAPLSIDINKLKANG